MEDLLIWPHTTDGSYLVKSAYQLLAAEVRSALPSSSATEGCKPFWNRIWNLQVPNKVKHFLCGEVQMSLYLPSLIYLHGTFSLRIFAVSVKNTPKILSIVFGCVTGSNTFGFQIQYLVHYDQRFLEVLAILFQQF